MERHDDPFVLAKTGRRKGEEALDFAADFVSFAGKEVTYGLVSADGCASDS
jgi:hypothetical protein